MLGSVNGVYNPYGVHTDSYAFRLFHRPYLVKIPRSFLYTKEYLDKAYLVGSGDDELDQTRMRDMVETSLVGAGLAMLYDQGCTVIFMHGGLDCVNLYRDIVGHLDNWLTAVQQNSFPDMVPIVDLYQFDRLAACLHDAAVLSDESASIRSEIQASIFSLNRRRSGLRLSTGDMAFSDRRGSVKPYNEVAPKIEAAFYKGEMGHGRQF